MAIKLNDALIEITSLLTEAGISIDWHKPRPLNPGMVADAATIRRIVNSGLMRKARDLELFKGKSTEEARMVLVADGSHEEWLGMVKQSYIPVIAELEKLDNAAGEGKVVPLSIPVAEAQAAQEVFEAVGEMTDAPEAELPAPDATVGEVQVSSETPEQAEAGRGQTENVTILDDAGHFPEQQSEQSEDAQRPEQDPASEQLPPEEPEVSEDKA